MSHHLDSPLARQDSRLDLTDHYVFRGETGTALIMNSNSSAAGEHWTPGFHPEARYEFKVHFDGTPYEDLAYRFIFGERGEDGRQRLQAYRLVGSDSQGDEATGTLVAEGETGSPISGAEGDGMRVWAGTVVDPFYLDLRLLALVGSAVADGTKVDFGDWQPGNARNSFAGSTVDSIVLELPDDHPQLRDGRQIGTWTATKLPTDAGIWRQINRQGHPMIWGIFRPEDSDYASEANSWQPAYDQAKDAENLADRIAAIAGAYGTADPVTYGEELVAALLPDVLPYRVGTPAALSFRQINGRMLADNAPEVMFSLVANAAICAGLSPMQTADTRSARFPYVVPAPGIRQ